MTLDFNSWEFWLIIIIVVFIILWMFFGSKEITPTSTKNIMNDIDHKISARNKIFEEYGLPNNYQLDDNINYPSTNEYSDCPDEKEIDVESSYDTSSKLIKKKFKSKGERLSCKIFEEYLGREVTVNSRPIFLRNHMTGRPLEYDLFDPESLIAVEYDGNFHYTFPNTFHKTIEDFYYQIYKDQLKKQLSEENGITLICIPHTVDTCNEDPNSVDGFKYCSSISLAEREQRLRNYLIPILDKIFIERQN